MINLNAAMEKMDEVLESTRAITALVEKHRKNAISREEARELIEGLLRERDASGAMLFPTGGARKPSAYRELFCRKGEALDNGGFKSFDEFATMALNRVPDPRLQKSWAEGIPSDGGLLVPSEYSAEIFDAAIGEAIVLAKARKYPMFSDTKKISGTCIGDHSEHYYGGVVGYWRGEGAALIEATPKYRTIELKANKLTCFGKSSIEWFEDAIDGMGSINQTFGKTAAAFLEKAFIKGSGAGEPLGILNSPCLVETPSQTLGGDDQGVSIVYKNIAAMFSRLAPGSWKNAVWMLSYSALAEILISLADYSPPISGTPRENYVVLGADGNMSILGRPAFVSEFLPALGTPGDIMLADLTQYAVGVRSDIRLELSKDVYFASAELAHRVIVRVDGQPLWNELMTLEDGSTTVSPFVVIEERTE